MNGPLCGSSSLVGVTQRQLDMAAHGASKASMELLQNRRHGGGGGGGPTGPPHCLLSLVHTLTSAGGERERVEVQE